MDIMGVLGMVIGLATVYLVMALSVTAANEGIAATLSSRGNWLKKGVLALLAPAGAPGGMAERMKLRGALWRAELKIGAGAPVAVSPVTIKEAIDAIALRDAVYQSPFIAHLANGPLGQGFVPSYIPAWTLLQGILHAATEGKETVFSTLASIKTAVEKLPEKSPVRVAVLNQIDGGSGSIDEFRKRFEAWFSEFEAQITAWYRQKTQGVVVVLSALLVMSANVDTFAILRQLSADPKLRAAVAQVGLATAEKGDVNSVLDTKERDDARKAHEEARKAQNIASAKGDPPTAPDEMAKLRQKTEAALETYLAKQGEVDKRADAKRIALEGTGLKLGWAAGEWHKLWGDGGAQLVLKMLGLLMSVLAVSLGAPFWFNVLKDLASVRAVGLNLTEQAKKKPG